MVLTMPYFGSLALICLSLSTSVLVPARPVASETLYAPYGNVNNPIEITIDVFSGVKNPTWILYPGNRLHGTIFNLLQWHDSTAVPLVLGYRGFKVFCSGDGGTDLSRTIGADSNVDVESLLLLSGLRSNEPSTLEVVKELLCQETEADTFCQALHTIPDTTTPVTNGASSFTTKTEPALPTKPTSFTSPSSTQAFITAIAGSASTTNSAFSSESTISTSTLPTTASSTTTISTSTLPTTPISFSPEATFSPSQATAPVTSSAPCNCPNYEPSQWNNNVDDTINNNCYNYATDTKTGTYAQPGKGSGGVYTALTGNAVKEAAIRDGLKVVNNPEDVKDEKCLVALVIWPGKDFHWLRRDASGYWSHKRGGSAVSDKDDSQKIIDDPRTADLGHYHFVTFMSYCPGKITVKK